MISLKSFAEVLKPLAQIDDLEPFPEVVPYGGGHAYIFKNKERSAYEFY